MMTPTKTTVTITFWLWAVLAVLLRIFGEKGFPGLYANPKGPWHPLSPEMLTIDTIWVFGGMAVGATAYHFGQRPFQTASFLKTVLASAVFMPSLILFFVCFSPLFFMLWLGHSEATASTSERSNA